MRAWVLTTGCAIRDVADRVPESATRLARMIDRADESHATSGTPEIRLTDLTKHFRDVRAVDRVSLDIQSGEFFSLLGPMPLGRLGVRSRSSTRRPAGSSCAGAT